MQVRHLAAYDVAPETISALRAAIGDELLPVQDLAVREGLLGAPDGGPGQSLIVAAPTSAGKSFVGELAAVHAASRGRRVLYLVPLKAMAEEVYRTLRGRYASLDLQVAISTRDRRDFDDAIESGQFHVAVLVYEKLHSLLVTRPELLGKVGLVVIDELQMLLDPERGPRLELLLSKLRRAQRSAPKIGAEQPLQLVALSAPLLGLEEMGDWLGAQVVLDERRPVELRSGVLHRGRFLYRSSRQTGDGADVEAERAEEELISDLEAARDRDTTKQTLRAVAALAGRGEQTLLFLPDRARSVEAARQLCGVLGTALPPAAWAMDEIEATDEGQARPALLEALRHGVAFHNSDLTVAQREIVERAFRRGEVRVLCATSTLSMGVNLPAKNVVLAERWRWRFSRRYGKWVRDELTKVEYDSMAGRAGRLGFEGGPGGFGRAVLVAPSRFDAEVWMRTLVGGPIGELEPALLGKPLGDVVLDLVASAVCQDEAQVIDFLLGTFTGHVRWARVPGSQPFAQSIGMTIEELVRNDLLHRDDGGALSATAIGRAAARKGLTARSAVLMGRWADAAAAPEVPLTALEVLLVCALTPDGGEAHVPLSLPEHRFGDYWTRILLKAQALGVGERRVFRWLRDQRGRLTYEQTKSVKKALLLLDWVDSHESQDIERDHNVWAGAVASAAAEFAWLVDSLVEICDARGWPSERTAALGSLAERLRYGVSESLLPLAREAGALLPRTHLMRVAAAGVTSPERLLQAERPQLERALSHHGLLEKIFQIQAARRALQAQKQPEAAPAVEAPKVAAVLPMTQAAAAAPAQPAVAAQKPAQVALPMLSVPKVALPKAPALDAATLEAATARLPASGAELPELRPVIVRRREAVEPMELVLLPETGPRQCFLQIGDRRVGVSPGSFALLARLALRSAATEAGLGWVRKDALGKGASAVRKSISRLRAELRRVDIEARSWIENDGHGNYRLSLSAPRLVLDKEALQRHPLATIRAVLRAA